METVLHNGGFSTKTDFRLENGGQVRLEVWFTTEFTNSNKGTYYNCNISTKGKGCRNWVFIFRSSSSKDERFFDFITEDQLYTAYFNHWNKLNPARIFALGSINSELVHFTVNEKSQPQRHYEY